MMTQPRPTLRQHAHDLAKAFQVNLVEAAQLARTPEEALAIPMGRTAIVAPITDESTYCIALHEMGHLVSPFGALHGSGNLTREAEDAAWAWAKHYALEWTPFMEQVATWARASYDGVEAPPARKPEPPAPAAPIGQQINWRNWK